MFASRDGPVLSTCSSADCPAVRTETRIQPPAGVKSIALASNLSRNWAIRSGADPDHLLAAGCDRSRRSPAADGHRETRPGDRCVSTLTLDSAERALRERLELVADCGHPVFRPPLLPVVEIRAVADTQPSGRNFPTAPGKDSSHFSRGVPTSHREFRRFRNLLCPPNLCLRSTNGIQRPNTNPKLNEAKGETS